MALNGPVTKDTTTLALGLAQIRVGVSATNIASLEPVLTASESIGALTESRFESTVEWWNHESGFPLLEDNVVALREKASLSGTMEEITPLNLAIGRGNDPTTVPQSGFAAHSGEIKLGDRAVTTATPDYVRVEARYVYPDGTSILDIIFPRAQVTSALELDFQKEDNAKVPVTFEAKRADSAVTGGHAVWDDRPLGWLKWS